MIITCPVCNAQFKSHHYQQKYCCPEHAAVATTERKRIEREQLLAIDEALLGQPNGYSHGVETCDWCHSKQSAGTLALKCWRCQRELGIRGPFRGVTGGPIVGY